MLDSFLERDRLNRRHYCPAVLTNKDVAGFKSHVLVSADVPVGVANYDPRGMERLTLLRVHRSRLKDREQGTDGSLQVTLKVLMRMLQQGMTVVMTMLKHRVVLVAFRRE